MTDLALALVVLGIIVLAVLVLTAAAYSTLAADRALLRELRQEAAERRRREADAAAVRARAAVICDSMNSAELELYLEDRYAGVDVDPWPEW